MTPRSFTLSLACLTAAASLGTAQDWTRIDRKMYRNGVHGLESALTIEHSGTITLKTADGITRGELTAQDRTALTRVLKQLQLRHLPEEVTAPTPQDPDAARINLTVWAGDAFSVGGTTSWREGSVREPYQRNVLALEYELQRIAHPLFPRELSGIVHRTNGTYYLATQSTQLALTGSLRAEIAQLLGHAVRVRATRQGDALHVVKLVAPQRGQLSGKLTHSSTGYAVGTTQVTGIPRVLSVLADREVTFEGYPIDPGQFVATAALGKVKHPADLHQNVDTAAGPQRTTRGLIERTPLKLVGTNREGMFKVLATPIADEPPLEGYVLYDAVSTEEARDGQRPVVSFDEITWTLTAPASKTPPTDLMLDTPPPLAEHFKVDGRGATQTLSEHGKRVDGQLDPTQVGQLRLALLEVLGRPEAGLEPTGPLPSDSQFFQLTVDGPQPLTIQGMLHPNHPPYAEQAKPLIDVLRRLQEQALTTRPLLTGVVKRDPDNGKTFFVSEDVPSEIIQNRLGHELSKLEGYRVEVRGRFEDQRLRVSTIASPAAQRISGRVVRIDTGYGLQVAGPGAQPTEVLLMAHVLERLKSKQVVVWGYPVGERIVASAVLAEAAREPTEFFLHMPGGKPIRRQLSRGTPLRIVGMNRAGWFKVLIPQRDMLLRGTVHPDNLRVEQEGFSLPASASNGGLAGELELKPGFSPEPK